MRSVCLPRHPAVAYLFLVRFILRYMKEPTEFQYFKAWLLFFLVATVGGGLIGLIIGSFVAAFLGAGRMPLPQMTRILQIVGFVIAIPSSYVTFRASSESICFQRSKKMSHPQRPNQSVELTATRYAPTLFMTKMLSFEALLALGGGSSLPSR